MNGKEYFRKCCKELGLDLDTYFFLCSQMTSKGNRYGYSCSKAAKMESQLFAVKYFEHEGFYLAWQLKKLQTTQNFSVSKKEVINRIYNAKKEKTYTVTKYIDRINGEHEIVYLFYPEALKLFLEKHIIQPKKTHKTK